MTSSQLRLFRDDLILMKQWRPEGETASGIKLAHHDSLPCIFADVVLAPPSACVKPGDFIAFPRYAGERVDLDDGVFYFLNVADAEAVINLYD